MRKLKILVVLAIVTVFYIHPKYQHWSANLVLENRLKEARTNFEIEKLKADKEAEKARALEEAVKARQICKVLFPCYFYIKVDENEE